MQLIEKIKLLNTKTTIKVLLFILTIPIIMKIIYFINILGIAFGTYLREISNCI